MQRVIVVTLSGHSYSLAAPAYDALSAYLERAEFELSDNPDKSDILSDIEEAIGAKCALHLSARGDVVTAEIMARVLDEMGPVQASPPDAPRTHSTFGANATSDPSAETNASRKRLYRIRDGAMIAGVCAGLGAYFGIDVTVVRLMAVALGLLSGGGVLLFYLLAMFIVPSAHTSEQWAQAHGVAFNAQEIIERAKREVERVSKRVASDWREGWSAKARASKTTTAGSSSHTHSEPTGHRARWFGVPETWNQPATLGPSSRVAAGIAGYMFGIVSAAWFVASIAVILVLLNTGRLFGFSLPPGVPLWHVLLAAGLVYAAIALPLRSLRMASYAAASGHSFAGRVVGEVLTLATTVAVGALVMIAQPEVRVYVARLLLTVRAIHENVSGT